MKHIDNEIGAIIAERLPHDRLRSATGSVYVYVLDQLVSPGSFQFSRGSGVSFRSSCRNRRRKRRKGKEKRREIRSATVKRTIRVVVGGIGGRDGRAEGERASERERERECVRGVPLRGTVERYLCDCPSSGRPLFCYNHVSARLRGRRVIYRHAALTVPTPRTPIQDVSLVTGVGPRVGRRSAAPKGAGVCSGLGERYHCTRNGNDVLIDPPLFCWPGRLPGRARPAMFAIVQQVYTGILHD